MTFKNRARLIDDVYATALGEQDWSVPLQGIRGLTHGRLANLLTFDPASREGLISLAVGDDDAWAAACGHSYNTKYNAHDPFVPVAADWDAGRWFDDHELGLRKLRSNQLFYEDFMRPAGMSGMTGLFLHRGTADAAVLSVAVGPESKGLTQSERRAIDQVHPHVSRALRMQQRLGQLESRAAVAESTLDALDMPVFILDEGRRLVWANRAGSTLMAREPALRFVHGRFAAEGHTGADQWRAACSGGGLLLRSANGAPLPMVLIPIPELSRLARAAPGRLMLMTSAQLRTSAARVQRLQLFYGFTEAEAHLAVLLACDGLSPQQCADVRGTTLGTVRGQLKALHAKTRVERAAQLVSVILQT